MAIRLRQGGFTLLEMLAVMALVGVACALLASAAMRGLAGARERQAGSELLQVLREAQVQARRDQRTVSVHFDLRGVCYQYDFAKRHCLPSTLQWTLHTAADAGRSVAEIHFYADGSSSGGNVRLRSASRETRINVSWLTGVASLVQQTP